VALAIDLGGTDLKSAVVHPSGRILHQQRLSSGSKEGKEKILERILGAIALERDWAVQKAYSIRGVGLGIPGIVSFPGGIVHRSPHFPAWRDYPLRAVLKKRLKIPFVLDNDANMAALGEGWRGAGRGRRNYVLLTLGTGIGGGIVMDGKIHHGDSGFAGELGHLVIEKNGRPCNCGGRGCLEMYASATGIQHELLQSRVLRSSTPEDLYQLATTGDKTAQLIYEKFGQALGAGIASIVNALDIELILLGGGLARAWKMFIGPVRQAIKSHTYAETSKRIHLKQALLANRAGLIGAAKAILGLDHK